MKVGTDDRGANLSQCAKFCVISFSISVDITSQIFFFDEGTIYYDPIFTPRNRLKFEEMQRTCQDNFAPRDSPLISLLLLQTGTYFAQTARTAFLTCW